MLQKGVATWAKSYYYVGLNQPAPDKLTMPEQEIVDRYQKFFLAPATVILYGDNHRTADPADVNRLLQTIKSLRIPMWLYTIRYVADKYGKLRTGDVRQDLLRMYDMFEKEHFECMLGDCFTSQAIVGYVGKDNHIVGDYPREMKFIIRKEDIGDNVTLLDLATTSPDKLSEVHRNAVRAAVGCGIVPEEDLPDIKMEVLVRGKAETLTFSVMDKDLPPANVCKLLASLPSKGDVGYTSKYHRVLDIMEHSPSAVRESVDSEAVKWVQEYVARGGQEWSVEPSEKTSKVADKNSSLSEEEVSKWIEEHYGLGLDELLHQPQTATQATKNLYTSAYLMDEEKKNMSAEEFVENVNKEAETMVGTLDDIIVAFCKEEGISHDCTIEQLIYAINYEGEILPPTIQEAAIKYKAENNVSGETTLDELIKGEKHVMRDDFDVACEVIKDSKSIDEVFKERICKALTVENAEFTETRIFAELLDTLSMSAEMRNVLTSAFESDGVVKIPNTEISNETVATWLESVGVDTKVIASISSGKFAEIAVRSDNVINVSDFSTYGAGYPRVNVKDRCYIANEALLNNIRKWLCDGCDTADVTDDQLRTDLIPVLYTFVRIIMMMPGDEDSVIEYLENKKTECAPYITNMLDEAITLFRG